MKRRDLQRRRANAARQRNGWAHRLRVRPQLFEADTLALAAAFGKPVDFPALDYSAAYRAAWAEAIKFNARDPSETVSQAIRLFLVRVVRSGVASMDVALVSWLARLAVRRVEAYNAALHRERRKVALDVVFPLGDRSDGVPEATRAVAMDWDALRRLSPMERKLAADYLRWLASTLPAAVHTLCSGGEEVNAAISISRFARDTTGLSKVVAWTHAKRVIQAFREGLYTV